MDLASMKVAVDVQPLLGSRTGVGYYTSGLLRALDRFDDGNEYELIAFRFFSRPFEPPVPFDGRRFRYRVVRFLPGRAFFWLLFHRLLPPVDLLVGRRDWYLFPNYISWPLSRSKAAVVVYDLGFLHHPQYVDEKTLSLLTQGASRSIQRADLIITISESTRREIEQAYPDAKAPIVVAPPGVDPELFAPPASDRIAAVRARYGLPERFVLFVGTIEPRKNLVGLLDGYAGLPADLRHTTGLVLVGIKGWKDDEIQQRIAELREEGSPVVMPGYVEEADLPALYGAADAFILPSFYEGFGMTVIEAMACGTPVIAADNSALPEAAGGAALLVDAHRPDQITEALLRVLTDDVLAADLRAKGLEHAGRFRWETSARAILGALAAAR